MDRHSEFQVIRTVNKAILERNGFLNTTTEYRYIRKLSGSNILLKLSIRKDSLMLSEFLVWDRNTNAPYEGFSHDASSKEEKEIEQQYLKILKSLCKKKILKEIEREVSNGIQGPVNKKTEPTK